MRLAVAVPLIFLTAAAGTAYGHAELVVPVPRSVGAQKTGPCGGVPRTATPLRLAPGSLLTVQFKETIEHPGYYRVAFSPSGDLGFDANILLTNIADKAAPANYTVTVQLPSTPCTGCTIQLIQVMLENPAVPTYYYSCADIELAVGLPDAGPGATPGPDSSSPSPNPDPKVDNGPDAPEPPGMLCAIRVGSYGGGSAALVLGAMLMWGGFRRRRRR